MPLRLLTYNIRHGGNGGRLAAVGEVGAAARPDVAAVQELRGLPPLDRVTGMRLHVAHPRTGQPVGLLVAPHVEILAAGRVRRPFHHAAAWVRVATAEGPLTVVSTHLFPYWGTLRLLEARWLAGFARRHGPVVVMGDLNSLSPAQRHPVVPRRHRTWWGRGGVDTRAMALLARRGLVDVFQEIGEGQDWTVPTGLGGGEFTRSRLDYVLASRAVAGRFTSCRVLTGAGAASASDHFPLLATIR